MRLVTEKGVHISPPKLQERIIQEGSDPNLRKNALEMLLLYEKCYLQPYIGTFNIERLVGEGIAEYAPYRSTVFELYEEGARALAPVILNLLNSRGVSIDEQRLERACRLKKEDVFGSFAASFRGTTPTRPPQIALDWFAVRSAFDEIMGMIWQSDQLNKSPVLTVLSQSHVLEKRENRIPSVGTDEEIVVGIFLSGLKHVNVNSLSDVAKYRGHKHVADFRNEVTDCIEKLREGRITQDQIKRKISKANEYIERLDTLTTIGQWLTWISIPVASMGALMGYPLGLITAPIGTSLLAARTFLTRRMRWTLISR